METVKRLFISLLVLLGCSAGAWAIEQDSDGFYLIGSVQDWEDFAALVQTTPTANAKMTADVDLGDDQTRIGDVAGNEYGAKFGGIFDGQGHTLTVAYNITGQNMCAPFTKTNGATIKNLHVAGTMRTEFCHLAGIIADAYGNNTIENVWVSADLTSANNYNSGGRILDLCGAFVGCKKTGTLSISNGLFSGSITTENGSIWNGAFLGYIDGENQSSATITNCLSVGTFSYIEHETTIPNRGTNTYCYVKQFPTTIPSEMQVTDEQLADGTIAAALGDGWAQDPLTHQPVPKIFTTVQDEDGYYLIGSVQDWKRFADIVNSGTNPAANAKMTADVDLGDDQTYISPDWHGEFSNLHYHGTFDGQGHTLTVHYNSDKYFHTPFSQTSGATIKNLHVAGTIKSTSSGPSHMSGLISNSAGNDVIQNVWVSADITGGSHSWIECGAFIGCNNCGNSTITDCLFTGSITTTGGNNGCFAGWVQSYNPSSITTTNCLSTGTFNIGSGSVSRGTLNNCYVKSYPYSIPSAMQVTDEQLANGTTAAALQADRSEEIWVQDPVLGIPMLKIFAKTEEDNPVTDLSATTTANSYIVSAAGKYKFKATVKGNGGLDPLTGTIATPIDPASIAGVKVLWELGDTYGRAIKYEDSAYDISYSDGYVYFSTPNSFTTGVACVAIYDSSDNILWSWDIWSTPEPGTATYNGNTFMDRNLCAVDLNYNRGFLYQWGRKDAFSAATGSYASFTFVPALFTAFNTVRGIQTIDYCIKHPTTHVNNGDENSWMSREEYEKLPWRDDIKTIYDPCPAGWRVPTAAEQNGYSGLPGTGFSNAINEFGNPGSGYYRSSTISSYPRAYAFRQSGQQNNWGTNPAFAIRPVKEGIYFIYTVPASGWGTFSAAENVIIPAGLTAYYCTTLKTYEDGKLGIRVSKLNGIIPANTGVLLEGSPGLSYPLTATTVEAAAPAENSLVAVVESEHIPATNGEYTNFMMKGGKFIKIQQDEESVKMPANHAYLPLLTTAISGSNAKEIMLYWDDEETTGIESLTPGPSPKGEGSIYNLNGQKLSAPQKGINIINGRKVIVK